MVGVLLLVGAGAGAAAVLGGDDEPGLDVLTTRPGSRVVAEEGAALPAAAEPQRWRIVYRLEERSGERLAVSTDVLSVERPFRSRLEVRRGAPPGGQPLSVEVGDFARLELRSASSATLTVAVPPAVAPADVRVQPVLEAAVERGLLERRERREVLGRPCQVYRSAGPLSAGTVAAPTADEWADACVDAAGLVLEEVYVVGGEPISRRIATDVDLDPSFAEDLFATLVPRTPVDKGGGSVREVDPQSRPAGAFFELEAPPAGFERRGRYEVIPPQAENFSDPLRDKFIVAGVMDVYTDGADLFVVDQGATLKGGAPFPDPADGSEVVEVEGLGTGEVLIDARGAELRFRRPNGGYVRLFGTVAPEVLEDAARRLVAVDGDGVRYLD